MEYFVKDLILGLAILSFILLAKKIIPKWFCDYPNTHRKPLVLNEDGSGECPGCSEQVTEAYNNVWVLKPKD